MRGESNAGPTINCEPNSFAEWQDLLRSRKPPPDLPHTSNFHNADNAYGEGVVSTLGISTQDIK